MGLTVKEEIFGLIKTFYFHKSWDSHTRQLVNSYLDEMEDVDLLIFDFTELESIDSTFNQTILNAIHVSHQKNITLKFQGLSSLTVETYNFGGHSEIFNPDYTKAG